MIERRHILCFQTGYTHKPYTIVKYYVRYTVLDTTSVNNDMNFSGVKQDIRPFMQPTVIQNNLLFSSQHVLMFIVYYLYILNNIAYYFVV